MRTRDKKVERQVYLHNDAYSGIVRKVSQQVKFENSCMIWKNIAPLGKMQKIVLLGWNQNRGQINSDSQISSAAFHVITWLSWRQDLTQNMLIIHVILGR
jgi:hypothetical protein